MKNKKRKIFTNDFLDTLYNFRNSNEIYLYYSHVSNWYYTTLMPSEIIGSELIYTKNDL